MEDTYHVLSWNMVGGSEKMGKNLTAHCLLPIGHVYCRRVELPRIQVHLD